MKLGVTMPTRTCELDRVPEYAALADRAGFDSVWDYEVYRNPFAMLCLAATTTDRVQLGTGLAVAGSRSPFEAANAIADVDELSGGRALMGIGVGVAEFLGPFHSNPMHRPLTRMREYIEVLRRSWEYLGTGAAPPFEGRYYGFTAPPFNPWGVRPLARESIPIYLGAVGPRMLALIGEQADGWIGFLGTPEYVTTRVRPQIAAGAERAGRDIGAIDLMQEVICCVAPDREVAMDRARKQVGFYVSHPTADPMIALAGLQDEQQAVRMGLLTEGFAALDKTDEKLIEAFSLTGTPEEVRQRVTEWDGVIDHLVLHTPYVPPLTADESDDAYRNIIDTFTGRVS